MYRKMLLSGLFLGGLAILTACGPTTTTATGSIQDEKGYIKERLVMQITEDGDHISASATLLSGETFTGKLVIAKTESSENRQSFDFDKDFSDDVFTDIERVSYSSSAQGVLSSGRRAMNCALTLSSPRQGFSSGGVGTCTISTGEVVQIQF